MENDDTDTDTFEPLAVAAAKVVEKIQFHQRPAPLSGENGRADCVLICPASWSAGGWEEGGTADDSKTSCGLMVAIASINCAAIIIVINDRSPMLIEIMATWIIAAHISCACVLACDSRDRTQHCAPSHRC